MDETHITVGGKWKYVFRAVEKHGILIEFLPLDKQNTHAAQRSRSKAATTMLKWPTTSITTHKGPSYLKRSLDSNRTVKFQRYETSYFEISKQHHRGRPRRAEQVIKPAGGFQKMNTATATIKGFEVTRIIRHGY